MTPPPYGQYQGTHSTGYGTYQTDPEDAFRAAMERSVRQATHRRRMRMLDLIGWTTVGVSMALNGGVAYASLLAGTVTVWTVVGVALASASVGFSAGVRLVRRLARDLNR